MPFILALTACLAWAQSSKPIKPKPEDFENKPWLEYESAKDKYFEDFAKWAALQTLKSQATPAGVVAAEVKAQAEQIEALKQKTSLTELARNARYQIVMSTIQGKNTFLLDTETGKVWQLTTFTFLQGDPETWRPMTKIDNDAEESRWVDTQTRKTAPKP